MTNFSLVRHPLGSLTYTSAEGEQFHGVVPVRAFPLQAPEQGIALVHSDGTELHWIAELSSVPEPAQSLIREELSVREWVPVIQEIVSVSSYATPCTWAVTTDRGATQFVLRAEEDIRRIGADHALLLTDANGVHYRIADTQLLSPAGKKILDRFL